MCDLYFRFCESNNVRCVVFIGHYCYSVCNICDINRLLINILFTRAASFFATVSSNINYLNINSNLNLTRDRMLRDISKSFGKEINVCVSPYWNSNAELPPFTYKNVNKKIFKTNFNATSFYDMRGAFLILFLNDVN